MLRWRGMGGQESGWFRTFARVRDSDKQRIGQFEAPGLAIRPSGGLLAEGLELRTGPDPVGHWPGRCSTPARCASAARRRSSVHKAAPGVSRVDASSAMST